VIPLADIRAAAERLRGRVHRTPLLSSRTLGGMSGTTLSLKCECFQKTGSFKPRGALNIVLSLSEAERARGLVTVSAGSRSSRCRALSSIAGDGSSSVTSYPAWASGKD